METSVDISLYPLSEDYLPAIRDFIQRVNDTPGIHVRRNDLSTQLFGDYDLVMDTLKLEIRRSWEQHGKGIFVIKFLLDDLRGIGADSE
ncbi:MAG: hypothetical protein KDI36_12720 [Pseudomonadales bacterium]|nr:hypothetical protein [Pseudomonadales bacterium]